MHSAGEILNRIGDAFRLVLNVSFKYFSDELPVQLMLPKAIQEAKNRQQLSSLALLGQGKF